uniref:NADH-ubiquinone oxidoreductase chain 3 n=1 Tax=Pectinatella magnifica TaxID=350071 RepID=A0A344AUW3_9BILA|nr:NADH dehydrogenase subunit 3 [Pectinatella magnifica]AWX65960.1 NADH dehydrogenase subunit 3 [Pectinatella magnifica]
MLSVSLMIFISLFLGVILLTLAWVLGNRSISGRSKSSPFECGFDPKDSARVPFSMRFFLLAILFLIFDVEVVLLFPSVLSLEMGISMWNLMASFLFLIILLLGLFHEWNQGSLTWVS